MHYTVQELASILNISGQEILLIENGKTNPSIDTCIKLAEALSCSIESLFGYVDEEPVNPCYYHV